ncbi:hypothetical protein JW865_00055 [Candidatus Bathyarchaeota archaeon]|nr:hypothetical protein [Candidatus Bathyarchaeota archaeon]
MSRVRVDKERLKRFDFEKLQAIRSKASEKPKLRDSFRKDFKAALEAEGVKVDEAFLKEIKHEWHEQISRDIKAKVAASPEKYPMLSRVVAGKPIRVHVTIEKGTNKVKSKEVK